MWHDGRRAFFRLSLSLHLMWFSFFLSSLFQYQVFAISGAETSDVLPGISSSFPQENGKIERPYFDIVGSRNVTTVVGQTAMLKCRVKHLGERTVSLQRKAFHFQDFHPKPLFRKSALILWFNAQLKNLNSQQDFRVQIKIQPCVYDTV